MEVIKVGATSVPRLVASSITGMMDDGKEFVVRAMGSNAVNQAVKACAIAGVAVSPSFTQLEIAGEERTAIEMEVIKQ